MRRNINDLAKEYRRLTLECIKKYKLPIQTLMLSGGIDSNTVLFSLLESGYRPRCYTFQLGDFECADVVSARKVCKTFGLEHIVCKCPQTDEQLIDDIRELFVVFGEPERKVFYQTAQCMFHVAKKIHSEGFEHSMVANVNGAVFAYGREMAFIYNREGDAGFIKEKNDILDKQYYTSFVAMYLGARHYDVETTDPYDEEDFLTFAKTFNHDECWKPYPKAIAVQAYREYWKKGAFLRPQTSMQVGTGVKAWHETLIKSKYNVGNHKDLMPIYKYMFELYKEGKL